MNDRVQPDKSYKGDLRRLTTFIRIAIAFFGVVLLAILGYTGWSANHAAVESERTLVENALNQSIARQLNDQKSVAWWDDSITNISRKRFDVGFIDANFGVFLTETVGQDEVYILDPDDRPVYDYMNSERGTGNAFIRRAGGLLPLVQEIRQERRTALRARPDAFGASQGNYKILLGAKLARWKGHILALDGRPAVVTAITIVPNTDLSILKGTPYLAISVTYIDDAFVKRIGRSLLLPDLTLSASRANFAGRLVEPFVSDDGTPCGYLSWTPRQPGQALLTIIMPLVAAAVFAAFLLSTLMFRRLQKASSDLAEREALARYEAKHDALSGLPNRHHFAATLTTNLARTDDDHPDARVVVAYIDLDRFKDINDTLGHHAGDALIRAVAHRLRAALQPSDVLARFGGDEFAVMRSPATPADASDLARALVAAFDESLLVVGQYIKMTASIGVAESPDHGATTNTLMRHADIALYEAKAHGRDRAMFFSPAMASELEARREIEVDLREAIETNALRLQWQPIVSSATSRTRSVEALLRWRHPSKGELSPSVFVPIAEDAGLMPRLGAWIIEHALAHAARWPDIQISINLSPVQFRHVDLERELPAALARHGVEASQIILEVTEGVLLEASQRTRQVIESLRRMGFKLALDDFGTGYSSLGYLCNFGFDKIKIDRAFVKNIAQARRSKTIVQAVVAIGRGLGMDIVAEGVETESEAAMMGLFGCQELQGYYFSRPVDADEIDARLNAERAAAAACAPDAATDIEESLVREPAASGASPAQSLASGSSDCGSVAAGSSGSGSETFDTAWGGAARGAAKKAASQ
jgi:diguanylate cyclase (GGDEF)-like protein